jgi:POT family proton-dependent oligopeptide transporter
MADGSYNMVRDVHAFKYGFLAAGIAMIIGTAIFYFLKNKYVVTPEGKPIGGMPSGHDAADYEEGESMKAEFSTKAILISLAIFAAIFFAFNLNTDGDNIVKLYIYPFIYASGVALATLILLDSTLTKVETQRIWVIYIMSFFIIFFWAAFEQAGSSLTFIADNQTDRDIFGWNMPPSMVQIFNGIFVVALAFPFSMLWDKLRAKNIEPLSTVKQSLGLLLIAVSYFIIAHNVKDLGNSGLLAIKWLILLYLIQTVAELCLSPIGLSLVGKLAPKRFASLAYGVFFISSAAGYALSGTLGSILPATGDKFKKAEDLGIDLQGVLDKTITPTSEQLTLLANNQISASYKVFAGFEITNLYDFFMVFVVLCGLAALILFALTPLIKKMMHGVR